VIDPESGKLTSMKKTFTFLICWLLFIGLTMSSSFAEGIPDCKPTRPDADGPFYRAGAPQRSQVGEGYILKGRVLSSIDCTPIAGARVEIWLNGPDGKYGDPWRATLYSDHDGSYRFESHRPVPYGSRPPHIHIIVNALGYAELITQHYPQPETDSAVFNLVLLPKK
jgi:protocatechuate 3,4-dioxygenase beta subunit